jgi:hypothetical protein
MLQPGEDIPSEGDPSSSATTSTTATYTSSSSETHTSATSTAAAAAAAAAAGHQGLSSGAIAGIAIGSSVVVLMAAALFFLLGRQKTLDDVIKRESFIAAGKDSRGPGRASMNGTYGYVASPGTISGSSSAATRKHQKRGDYYDGNSYDPRHPGQGEYLAPVPILPRRQSPGVLEPTDDGPPTSPQGSVSGGRYVI